MIRHIVTCGRTTDARPRSLVWLQTNGIRFAQIWFEEPRVGCEDLVPIAERNLDPCEYAMTLDELVAKYPAPVRQVTS